MIYVLQGYYRNGLFYSSFRKIQVSKVTTIHEAILLSGGEKQKANVMTVCLRVTYFSVSPHRVIVSLSRILQLVSLIIVEKSLVFKKKWR